jgi:hypothetical protein
VNKYALLAVIQPSDSEITEAEASFSYTPGGWFDLVDRLPYLVMVRRAYRAGFYTDTLPESADAADSGTSSHKPTRKPKRQPSLPATRTVRSE